jgi:hypothetical protein
MHYSVGDLVMLFGGILIVAIFLPRALKMEAVWLANGRDGFSKTRPLM